MERMTGEPKPREPKRGLHFSFSQILIVVALVIGLSVILDFNRRIQAEQRIVSEADQLRVEVTALAATESALATELAYYSSDAYVQDWAHGEGGLVLPGEVQVVPVAPSGPTPTPAPAVVTASSPAQNNLDVWWELFFGSGS